MLLPQLAAVVIADVCILPFFTGLFPVFPFFHRFLIIVNFSAVAFVVIVGPRILASQVYTSPIPHPFRRVCASPGPCPPRHSI